MSTPSFVPQTEASMVPIRYFTEYDPYFYTVDNRPLQDIASNLVQIGSGGGDSARRAAMLTQLNLSAVLSTLYDPQGSTGTVDGFHVSLNGTTLQIGSGGLYLIDAINTDISTSVLKQALSVQPTTFTLTAPNGALGDTKDYLVQIKMNVLDATTMPTSNLPFLDATNTLLPGLLMNGEAVITIKEGVTASYGSQVTPTADVGFMPLYVITYCTTAANNSVKMASGSPRILGGSASISLYSSNILTGTGNSSITVPLSLVGQKFNPLAPIKIRALYSVSVPNNAAALQVGYLPLSVGSSVSASQTLATKETVTMPGTSGTLAEYVTSTSVIPTSAFAGFVSNVWQVNQKMLRVTLNRLGDDAADTTNGDITVLEIQAFQ
ncbi:MAG TPA: hypothetical protein VFM18_21130 [Methanosarcina sp.]|nr:hypothetical protein [Methanosarcina sp.]